MFFLLSKIIGPLIDPFLFGLLLLLIAGVLLVFRKAPRWRRWFFVGSLAIMICFSFAPIANLLILPLETRYARPARLSQVPAAIVMLAGMLEIQPRAPDGGRFWPRGRPLLRSHCACSTVSQSHTGFFWRNRGVIPGRFTGGRGFGKACAKVGDCCGSNEDRCCIAQYSRECCGDSAVAARD